MTRYRFKRHDNGTHTTSIDIPFRMPNGKLGAVRVGASGDDAIESLGIANNIADQITSDPVLAAIMPPQAKIAILAVKGLHAAAEASGDAGIKKELAKYDGDGAKRVAKALGQDTKDTKGKSAKDSKKGADMSTGFYGLPSGNSVGDTDDDDDEGPRQRRRRRSRRGRRDSARRRDDDFDSQEGANYAYEEWARMRAQVDRDLALDDGCEDPHSDEMSVISGLQMGHLDMMSLPVGDMQPEDFSSDPTYQQEEATQQAFYGDDDGFGMSPQYAAQPYPVSYPYPSPYPPPFDPSMYGGGYNPYDPYGGGYGAQQQQGYDQYGNPTTTPDGQPWPVDNFGNPLPSDSNGYPITPPPRPAPKATVTRIGKGGKVHYLPGAERSGKLTRGAAVYAGGGGAGGGGQGSVYNAGTGQFTKGS